MPKMFASRSLQQICRPLKASSRLSSIAQQNQQPSQEVPKVFAFFTFCIAQERMVRPATAQMDRLTDIGARSIFTSEQVIFVKCADRCVCRICSERW